MPDPPSQIVSFWHFWSEPHQQQILDSLITEFEQNHDSIKVVAVPLSWSDGKAKLQLAFNSGNAPDVVHLGLDWFSAFNSDGVFAPLPFNNGLAKSPNGQLWTVNARAMVMSGNQKAKYFWGLCGSDNHNVLKRTLPIIWQQGAPLFCTRLPISATMDSSLVDALWSVSQLAGRSLIARSRDLDEALIDAQLTAVYTGMWIQDMAAKRGIESLQVVPTPSILNGDVLAISAASNQKPKATVFIEWISNYDRARDFCLRNPDAGFPAGIASNADSTFATDAFVRGFLETVRLSAPLPDSKSYLEVEPILERLIEECYRPKSRLEVKALVEAARVEIQSIEQRYR